MCSDGREISSVRICVRAANPNPGARARVCGLKTSPVRLNRYLRGIEHSMSLAADAHFFASPRSPSMAISKTQYRNARPDCGVCTTAFTFRPRGSLVYDSPSIKTTTRPQAILTSKSKRITAAYGRDVTLRKSGDSKRRTTYSRKRFRGRATP